MQKWEYLHLPMVIKTELILSVKQGSYYGLGQLQLGDVGEDGWELVSVDNGIAYFKRPVPDEEIKPHPGTGLVWKREGGDFKSQKEVYEWLDKLIVKGP